MISIAGTALAASRTARRPACFKFEVDWDGDGNYTDESAYVDWIRMTFEAVNSRKGFAAVGGAVSDGATVALKNTAHDYAPWHGGGRLYSYIAGGGWEGAPVKISLGFKTAGGADENIQRFTGVIDSLTHDVKGQVASLICKDRLGWLDAYYVKTVLYENVSISAFAETLRSALPAAIKPALPTAGIDKSMFSLPYAWANDDQSVMRDWSQLAEAEGGRAYCDAQGRFMFENAVHMITGVQLTSQATFTVSNFANMTTQYGRRDRARKIIVYFTRPVVRRRTTVWQAPYPYIIKPGETKVIRAQFNTAAKNVRTPISEVDYWAMTYAGDNRTDQIAVTMTLYAQQALLEVVNSDSEELVLSLMKLEGYPIEFGDEESVCFVVDSDGTIHQEIDTIVETAAGLRPLEIKDNYYIQTPEHAGALGELLAYRLKEPRLGITLSNIQGMPWLETGDRIMAEERGGLLAADFYVNRIDLTVRARVMNMVVQALMAEGLFASGNYFRLGTDALGGGKVYFL